MSIYELAERDLRKAENSLAMAKKRPNVPAAELEHIENLCRLRKEILEIIKSEWISVDERLPEDGVWVLGYSAKSGRGGLCNCLKSYVREFGNYDDTTHWLPLPEFPKKKGE
jgi:hypothetical protein